MVEFSAIKNGLLTDNSRRSQSVVLMSGFGLSGHWQFSEMTFQFVLLGGLLLGISNHRSSNRKLSLYLQVCNTLMKREACCIFEFPHGIIRLRGYEMNIHLFALVTATKALFSSSSISFLLMAR